LAKTPVMPSKSSVGSEKFEESTLKTDPLIRSNLQVQNVSESVVTPSHQKRAMAPVSSLETLQGKEDGRFRLDVFPRTSATSTTTTTLQPTLNAPETSLQGGNRVFSAAKIYQRGEETSFSKSSSNSRENLTNPPVNIKVESSPRGSKSVNSQRGSLETRAITRHKPSITSVFKTPTSHSTLKESLRLKLRNEYESDDSESEQSERIHPREGSRTKEKSSSKNERGKNRFRKNHHSDDEPSSSSSESSSSSDSSDSSSDSSISYRSVRGGGNGKKRDSKYEDESDSDSESESDDSGSSTESSSTGSERSVKRRTRKNPKKANKNPRSSSKNNRSRKPRDDVAIRYIQSEPREFAELKLERLTVDDAVRFLEKYNNLCSVHNQLVPHISRFIPLNVQHALVSAKAAHKGKIYKSYDGLYELTTKKVLSMIHHAVIAAEVGNKKQYLEQLKRARFPMDVLGKDYQPTASNFKLMRDALAKFQMVFVTRWKFLKKKTPKSFHLPLQKRQHEIGMIQVFTDIIPYGIGKAILENIPLKTVKDCGNNFEQFLREFFKQVEYLMECHRKAQFLNTIVYSERNREERESRKSRVQHLEDDLEEDAYLEMEPQMEGDLDDHVYALGPVSHSSTPSKLMNKSQQDIEKSPGGCIQLVQLGSCKKPGCKYIHDDPTVLQATWWHYARRFFNSPYRASKAKVIETYKDLPGKVTMLTRARCSPIQPMQEKSQCLDDPVFEDSPQLVEMLMKSAFPEVEYVDKIHRSGKVILYVEPPIEVSRALFDTGALSANYICQTLVDKHRGSLGH